MYSKASWGGEVDPFILVTFMKQEGSNKVASLLMYEWKDFRLIGQLDPENRERVSQDDNEETPETHKLTTV
jgi:hypothetical protein